MARSPFRRPSTARLAAALVGTALVAGCNAFPNPPPPRGFDGPTQVTVAPGETLETIARRYNVPVSEIAAQNGLQPPYSVPPGTVLSLPQPRLHVVQPGESLYTIAQSYGVDVAALASRNNIGEPYAIYVGETLRLPEGGYAAPVVASGPATSGGPRVIAGPGPAAPGTPGGPVDVAPLDDLPAQPDRPQPLAEAPTGAEGPGPDAPAALPPELGPDVEREREETAPAVAPVPTETAVASAGFETVPVPPGRAPVPSTRAAAASPPTTPAPVSQDAAAEPTPDEPGPTPTTEAAAAPAATPDATSPPPAAGTRFRWPVAGDMLSGFGPKPDGSHNDGINVAAPRGTPIVAAQNGVVAYVGDEIEGFGNLVLLRHADGWVTAYAHADRVLVAAEDEVAIGQTIATVGTTGDVTTPQLHFEIRRGTEPVDPAQYLTSR